MFLGIGVIVLVGFVMYRLGKSAGSSSTREEIKKQRLRRKIAQRKAMRSGTPMAGQTGVKAAQTGTVRPVSHGHPGSYRSAIAAGVLGAAAGAALMHNHDEVRTQDQSGQVAGIQSSGNDLPEDSFMDDSYDVDDDTDPDEMQDGAEYDADGSYDSADDDADDDVNNDDSDYDGDDSSDDDYSDSGSDDGGSFFDDSDDDGFF